MPPETDLDDFLQKWRAAWPEWPLAQVFVPDARRAVAEAWLALQLEWVEAAWGGEDPTPGFAKLAWWQDELRGWQKGARRHPLGSVLQRAPAPWAPLADALETLRTARAPLLRGDLEAAATALAPAASCIADAERGLFMEPIAPERSRNGGDGQASAQASICWALIAQHRLWQGTDAASGDAARLREALLARRPGAQAGSRAGRIHAALVLARLRQGSASPAPVAPLRVLWLAWRAARG